MVSVLKIRKGNPVGFKVILTQKKMYQFFDKFLAEIAPKLKNKLLIKTPPLKNILTCNFNNILIFKELETNYVLFNSLKNLQVIFITDTKTIEELFFLFNSFKFSTKTIKNK